MWLWEMLLILAMLFLQVHRFCHHVILWSNCLLSVIEHLRKKLSTLFRYGKSHSLARQLLERNWWQVLQRRLKKYALMLSPIFHSAGSRPHYSNGLWSLIYVFCKHLGISGTWWQCPLHSFWWCWPRHCSKGNRKWEMMTKHVYCNDYFCLRCYIIWACYLICYAVLVTF